MFAKKYWPLSATLILFLSLHFLGCGASHSFNPAPSPTPPQGAQTEFLYATGQNQILSFAINSSDGSLTALPVTPGPNNGMAITNTMVADPSAKFLFVYDAANNGADVFSINANNGGLTAVDGSPFSNGMSLLSGLGGGVLTDSTGQFLYVPDLFGFGIFTVDGQTGTLTPITGSPFSDSDEPFEMVRDSSGKYVYANDLNSSATSVSGFAIDSDSGALTELATSPFPITLSGDPFGTHLWVAGEFLFRSSLEDNQIEAWSIDKTTGELTAIPGSPFSTGVGPISIATDAAGKFIYVANLGGGTISGYNIDVTSGVLTGMAGSPFSVGADVNALAIDPSGRFLYAANPSLSAGTITGFNINSSTGTLTVFSQGRFSTGAPLPRPFTQLLTVKTP